MLKFIFATIIALSVIGCEKTLNNECFNEPCCSKCEILYGKVVKGNLYKYYYLDSRPLEIILDDNHPDNVKMKPWNWMCPKCYFEFMENPALRKFQEVIARAKRGEIRKNPTSERDRKKQVEKHFPELGY